MTTILIYSNPTDYNKMRKTLNAMPTKVPSAKYEKRIRDFICKLIEKRLSAGDYSKESPRRLAKALEHQLFSKAPTFEEYADPSTLNQRLRSITFVLLRHRLMKQGKQEKGRKAILRSHLGENKFNKVIDLKHQINQLRLEYCSEACTSCGKNGACSVEYSRSPLISSQNRPPVAVQSLFFHTSLCYTSSIAPERIPSVNWDKMILQAEENIRCFQEWRGLTQKKEKIVIE